MPWVLRFDPLAQKELAKLDKGIQRSVKKFLDEICQLNNPADRGHGLTGPWVGFHRYRIGQLRIMAHIDRNIVTITVIKIDKRDSIY